MSIESYNISVPDDAVTKLSQRLSLTSFPDQLEGDDNWEFGTPVSEIKRLVGYWNNGFDWRKTEAKLNELPNFMASIEVEGFDAVSVHFVHQVSSVEGAIPLLFSHGWPGSFIEVTKLLPLLKGGSNAPAFHLVAPSLPNFGFSSGISKRGFGPAKYAETCHKLMMKLGYSEYVKPAKYGQGPNAIFPNGLPPIVTQGGDWGFSVTRAIGLQYPEHCKASHINLVLAHAPTFTNNPLLYMQHAITPYTTREKDGRARSKWFEKEGYGYNILQSTKPQTIGYALTDSPVALLAWIYEKLHDWTDGPAASVRIYYEATHPPEPETKNNMSTETLRHWIPTVKLGVAHFPRDIRVVPKAWARTLGPVCFESSHERGGHFAAWEAPEAISGDLRSMFGVAGPCFGVVKGKNGYGDLSSVE